MVKKLVHIFWHLTLAVHVLGQTGFTSIDCGSEELKYVDPSTGISFTSDSIYIEAGVNSVIGDPSLPKPYQTVRSFPTGKRNCYSLEGVNIGFKYLVRASFMYGNYDGLNKLPEFDIYLGVDLWLSVKFDNSSHMLWSEIIIANMTSIDVCLINKDSGTPFISILEFRRWRRAMYHPFFGGNLALVTFQRVDFGSIKALRYPEDSYDRIWSPESSKEHPSWKTLTSTNDVNGTLDEFDAPKAVLQTAVESNSSKYQIDITWSANPSSEFHVVGYFSELVDGLNISRKITTYIEGAPYSFVPTFGFTDVDYDSSPLSGLSIYTYSVAAKNIAPLLNAFEIFLVLQLSGSATSLEDVSAIMSIKERYRIRRNWKGDPCLPQDYPWIGLGCNYDNATNPRIISLDLSMSNLTGDISDFISTLTALNSINLANNSLRGSIPDSLGDLPNLEYLYLEGNQLNGTIPEKLKERINKGTLTLRIDDHTLISKKSHRGLVVGIVITAAVSLIVLVVVILAIKLKIRKQASLKSEMTKRIFTYKEVVSMTKDFQSIIGRGGSGVIYHGCLRNGREVAVKVLDKSQFLGPKEFSAEVKMLMMIHHRYLVSFIGFCEEGGNMILIYEYMSYGSLGDLLSGKDNKNIRLTWEQRLRIALTVAQGLEYLHYGCKTPIIHRDIKTTNILINERLEAKIADFGLSKTFPSESMSHITTVVVGTNGYLDPEYYITNKLTEKSDVYSFGIVLLQLITGRQAIIIVREERMPLLQWVTPMLQSGDVQSITDPMLEGDYHTNSIWKVAEIAVSCTAHTAIMRPTMSQVVVEIKEAIDIEMERLGTKSLNMELTPTPETSTLISHTDMSGPSAR